VIYIQNTNADRKLVINKLKCAAVDAGTVVSVWTLFEVTSAGAATGTTITAQNTNLDSGVVAAMNAFGDAAVGGTLTGNTLGYAVANHDIEVELITDGAVTLAENDAIAVTVTDADAPAAVYVTALCHYEEKE